MSLSSRFCKAIGIGLLGVLGLCLTACEQDEPSTPSNPPETGAKVKTGVSGESWCPLGEAKETDGVRRLALVVGVGQYRNARVPDLIGPPNDARRFYDLLTDANGYGFPRENVCLLLD